MRKCRLPPKSLQGNFVLKTSKLLSEKNILEKIFFLAYVGSNELA